MSCPEINGKYYCCPGNKPSVVSRPALPSLPDLFRPRSTCYDAAANCFDHIRQCNSPDHISTLRRTCAKTCAFCSGMMRDEPGCVDTHEKCEEWQKKGFCEMEDVDAEQKKQQCAKTCGLC
uniref:ShTK domain protein n=1 Tax=Steinernema glaseri TaxID=37863 RepID=A0A1I8APM4_9BILA